MNFFEHQERARRNTRRLVLLFALAVVAVIVAVDCWSPWAICACQRRARRTPLRVRRCVVRRRGRRGAR